MSRDFEVIYEAPLRREEFGEGESMVRSSQLVFIFPQMR